MAMVLIKKFWQIIWTVMGRCPEIAKSGARHNKKVTDLQEEKLIFRVKEKLNLCLNDVVLDIGCGESFYLFLNSIRHNL